MAPCIAIGRNRACHGRGCWAGLGWTRETVRVRRCFDAFPQTSAQLFASCCFVSRVAFAVASSSCWLCPPTHHSLGWKCCRSCGCAAWLVTVFVAGMLLPEFVHSPDDRVDAVGGGRVPLSSRIASAASRRSYTAGDGIDSASPVHPFKVWGQGQPPRLPGTHPPFSFLFLCAACPCIRNSLRYLAMNRIANQTSSPLSFRGSLVKVALSLSLGVLKQGELDLAEAELLVSSLAFPLRGSLVKKEASPVAYHLPAQLIASRTRVYCVHIKSRPMRLKQKRLRWGFRREWRWKPRR